MERSKKPQSREAFIAQQKSRRPPRITRRKEKEILAAVQSHAGPDARDPETVIATIYSGNRDRWLRDMARQYGINI